MRKKVLFVHYKTGERDGVSLEIEKRAAVARELGAEVYFLTGFDGLHRKEAAVIPQMELSGKDATTMRLALFDKKTVSEEEMLKDYARMEEYIQRQIDDFLEVLQPDTIFVHNMLAHAYNLPATTALLKSLDKHAIPTTCVHHDFWFERPKFDNPQYEFVKEILKNLPPTRSYIKAHYVINSIAERGLYDRTGIKARRIGDYFDYSKPQPKLDDFNKTLPQDIGLKATDFVVLQATRIVKRKAIENAITFVHELQKQLHSRAPIKVGNKLFTKDSRVVLLFTNFVEADEDAYVEKLNDLAKELNVTLIWADKHFAPERVEGPEKKYSFWDGYLFADLVTYPSTWEGFGNQFLEAVFFKKLPVIFEYPVFVHDIKGEGYTYISLGDTITEKDGLDLVPDDRIKRAADETISVLQRQSELKQIVEENTEIAERHHDESLLKLDFKKLLNS